MRILFADDSMTAQNMGKRILTDAGYEVIAVSNGAAAVKKIAEQKPDIIILDVYMPGYTGLEVCEKVRASMETLKTPVLLTVGKLEPYRAEDANRVKADGVIIKPFEASDLLAIVKKLEQRVATKQAPVADQTVFLDRPPDFSQFGNAAAAAPAPVEFPAESGGQKVQGTVEVPDHMATASAFSDLLGSESSHMMEPFPVSSAELVEEPLPAAQVSEFDVSSVEVSTVGLTPEIEASELEAPEIEAPKFQASKFVAPKFEAAVELPEPTIETARLEPQVDAVVAHEPEIETAAAPEFEPERMETPLAAAVPERDLEINVVQSSGGVPIEPVPDTQAMPVYAEPDPVAEELSHVAPPPEIVHETALEPVSEVMSADSIIAEPMLEVAPPVENVKLETSGHEEIEDFEPAPSPVFESTPPVVESISAPVFESTPPSVEEVEEEVHRFEPQAAFIQMENGHEHLAPVEDLPIVEPVVEEPVVEEEDDFDARVAAAMAAYDEAAEKQEFAPERVAEPEPVPATDESTKTEELAPVFTAESPSPDTEVVPAVEAHELETESPVSFEYSPPIRSVEHEPYAAPPYAAPMIEVAPNLEQPTAPAGHVAAPVAENAAAAAAAAGPEVAVPKVKHESELPTSVITAETLAQVRDAQLHTEQEIVAGIESELPAASKASPVKSANHKAIADVVHRVMERFKPELIAEIVRELDSNK